MFKYGPLSAGSSKKHWTHNNTQLAPEPEHHQVGDSLLVWTFGGVGRGGGVGDLGLGGGLRGPD